MRDSESGEQAYKQRFTFKKKMIFIPFIALAVLAAISYVVMLLWNGLLPEVLHTGAITYWQAMGLLVLSKILFSGFGRGGRGGAPWMRHRMEHFKNMSPEEKDRFRQEMRARCSKWGRYRGAFEWDQPAGNTEKPATGTANPLE